ncbi:MAG TPA: MGMT family protein [Verrucomicrobiota bacterium]|nr:cysteine methyltransferase [Verrucomicrobiales bacterium]HRI11372.1 MGMT family protein [Verrucomicrobiota bacterium]
MPKARSLAFARIRAEVMAATCKIPPGRITTYATIASHLEITPRHVAFVLAALKQPEADMIPWHRVVAQGGELRSGSEVGLRCQRQRLGAEGIRVAGRQVADFDRLLFRWPARLDRPGMPVRRRYADPSTQPVFPESARFGYLKS